MADLETDVRDTEPTPATPKSNPKAHSLVKKVGAYAGMSLVLFLVVRSCQKPDQAQPQFYQPTQGMAASQATPKAEEKPSPEESVRSLVEQAQIARNAAAQETIEAFQRVESTLILTRACQVLNDLRYEEQTTGMPVERALLDRLKANHQELAKVKFQKGTFSGKAEDIGIARSLIQDGLALSMALQAVQTGKDLECKGITDPTEAILWAEKYLTQTQLVLDSGRLTTIANRKPEDK